MGQVSIDSSVDTSHNARAQRLPVCWKDATNGYAIYLNTHGEIAYKKSTNGGANYSGGSGTLHTGGSDISGLSVWADWETPGDTTGTKIWFVWLDESDDKLHYGYLDTSDDSHATGDIHTYTSIGFDTGLLWHYGYTSFCKSRSGYLYVYVDVLDDGAESKKLFCSTNNGSTWAERDLSAITFSSVSDIFYIFPAGGLTSAGENDIWAIHPEYTGGDVDFCVYTYSANSWSEELIYDLATTLNIKGSGRHMVTGAIRQSTGHLIACIWHVGENDVNCYDIAGAGDITNKGSFAKSRCDGLTIDEEDGRIYVYYYDGSYSSSVSIEYAYSDDWGANWTTDNTVSDDNDDYRGIISGSNWPLSTGGNVNCLWFDDDDNDIFTCTTEQVVGAVTQPGTPSSTLLYCSQVTGDCHPYCPVEYYTATKSPKDANGSWTRIDLYEAHDRIIEIDWVDEVYGSECVIKLKNPDGAFDSIDPRGCWVRVGRGWNDVVDYHGYYKCVGHYWTSSQDGDNSTYVMYCVGGWNLLSRYMVANPNDDFGFYYFNQADLDASLDNYTIKEIIDYFCTLADVDLGTSISEDSYIDVLEPIISFQPGMTAMQCILQVLALTSCSLISEDDYMYILNQNTGDTRTYVAEQDGVYQPFSHGILQEQMFTPMKVTVQDITGAYSGSYSNVDPAYDASMGEVIYTDEYGVVDGAATAAAIAMAEVKRAQSQASSGEFHLQLADCNANVFDSTVITDTRGNTTGTGVLGGVYGYYRPDETDTTKIFSMDVRVGGLQRSTNDKMQSFVDEMCIGISKGAPTVALLRGSVDANVIRQAMQPFTTDLTIEAKDADEVFWHGKAGVGNNATIYFADGSELTITEKVEGSAQAVSGAQWLYFIVGDNTLHITTDEETAHGSDRGIVALVVENTDGDGDCMIIPGNGRVPLLSAVAITCDYLSALTANMGVIETGTIKLLTSGSSWTSWVNPNTASGMVVGLDADAFNGSGDGKLETYIGGSIRLALNKDGLQVFSEDLAFVTAKYVTTISTIASDGGTGVQFNTAAAHGLSAGDEIVIHFTDDYNGVYVVDTIVDADSFTVDPLTYVGSETTGKLYTVQCKVDGNGAIASGGGTVILDENGIAIKDSNDSNVWLQFQDAGGTKEAEIFMDSSENLLIRCDADLKLVGYDDLYLTGVNHIYMSGPTYFDDEVLFEDEQATITAGVLVITKSRVRVVGEGDPAAADQLDSITNAAGDGNLLILHCDDAANDITVKHNNGNIMLQGGVDCVLGEQEDVLLLVYDLTTTSWLEISRSLNT